MADQGSGVTDVVPDTYTAPKPAAAVMFESDTVPPSAVMEHPANPRKDLGDLSELEESIREVGIVQSPVVLPAARVAAAWPQHAAEIGAAIEQGVQWVVLVGARRSAAAAKVGAGDDEYQMPIAIRRDGIADDALAQLDLMTVENIARKPLSPVEEARSFDAQVKAGRSQRTIAARMGCSQGHVSKRLKLLRLPTSMLDAVEAGTIEIGDGMAYVDAAYAATEEITDEAERTKQAKFLMLAASKLREQRNFSSPAGLVREVQQELERKAAREAAQARLQQENVEVIESGHKQFGNNSYDHVLRTDTAVEKAREAGTLVAEVTTAGGVTYYSTAKPKRKDNRSEREEADLALRRAREQARKERDKACAALVAAAPKIANSGPVDMLITTILLTVNADAAKLAKRWLLDAGVLGDEDAGLSPYQLSRALRGRPWQVRAATAYALGLGVREMRIRWEYLTWDVTDADYLQTLIDLAGYQPAPYEQAKLDELAQQAGPADECEGQDEPSEAELVFDDDDAGCWVLYVDGDAVAYAEDLIEAEDVDAAQQWAQAWLADGVIHQDGDVLHCRGCGAAAGIHDAGDPIKTIVKFTDQHSRCSLPERYRLRFTTDENVWQLLADDRVIGDHDGLDPLHDADARTWAAGVLAEHGVPVSGWQLDEGGTAFLAVPTLATAPA